MAIAKTQSSEKKPQAVSLLRDFLAQNHITLNLLPFKTYYDNGKLVIEPPQIAVDFTEDTKKK
jgi:hypothetical protein